jgi:hypothetical protein
MAKLSKEIIIRHPTLMKTSIIFDVLAIITALSVFFFVRSRPPYKQRIGFVAIRKPGKRLLGPPEKAASEAAFDVIPAFVSQAAYQRRPPDPQATKEYRDTNISFMDPDKTLCALGWVKWPDFLDTKGYDELKKVHLRVEVWSSRSEKAVIVAFGGTEFRNLSDWRANLRWFIPIRHDEYSVLTGIYVHRFIDNYKRLAADEKFNFLPEASLYSTGHSLGGGLAQAFAYALPLDPKVPRVTKVYAFDPTPVTSFTSIDRKTRNTNKMGLKIDRIYERREILAILRSITSFFHVPPASDPTVRQIRYNLFPTINVLHGHSMSELAALLWRTADGKPVFPEPIDGKQRLVL